MTLKDRNFRRQPVLKLNEEKLKHYFLGKLPEAEKSAFEEEIALEEKLTEEAQIVEGELIDDYLRGNLSAADRELFETVYLTTEARREKLSLAKSLWQVANEQKTSEIVEKESPSSFWQFWNAWRVAFVGVAALLLLGAGVLFWLNSRGSFSVEFAQQRNSNEPLIGITKTHETPPIENVNSVNGNVNNSNLQQNKNASPTPKTTPTPTPEVQSAPTLASFTLLPGTLRDEGEQSIKIAPNTQKINLRLNLPKDAAKYQTYVATIKTADGETVFTAPNLKSLNFTLPAEKLENRTYIIFLEGKNAQNSSESIAEYTFRVRR